MVDWRPITFNKDLLDEHTLGELKKLVAAEHDLELCYRGNSPKNKGREIVIYYNNHVVFDIVQQIRPKGRYKLTFDFNHARFKDDWEEDYKNLAGKYGFSELKENKNGNGFEKISTYFYSYTKDEWEKLYRIIKDIMDNYFALTNNKVIDYFKEGQPLVTKKKYYEKQWQQRIFSGNTDCANGYFIYDMEFAKSHKDTADKNNDKNNDKPDMLAIKYVNSNPNKLAFVEVKSTTDACKDDESGVKKHLSSMAVWLDEYYKNMDGKFMEVRKNEAAQIIADYAAIGLRKLKQKPNLNFSDIDIEFLLIFTDDEAIQWAKDNRKDIESYAGDYLDKLVIAKADEKGKILPL